MQIETVRIPADNAKGYKIVNADDPRAQAPDLDGMKKADLVKMLEERGGDASGKVDDLRARLREMIGDGSVSE